MNWREEIGWAAWIIAGSATIGAVMSGGDIRYAAESVLIGALLWIALRLLVAAGFEIADRLRFRRQMRRLAQATPEQIQKALDHLVELGYIERIEKPEEGK